MEVKQKGPDKQSLGFSASVGPLNSKLFLNFPVRKQVDGVVLGVRGAYPNYVLGSFPDESIVSKTKASYYDVTMKYDHEFKHGSSITADLYVSGDEFNLSRDTTFKYASVLAGLSYATLLSEGLSLQLNQPDLPHLFPPPGIVVLMSGRGQRWKFPKNFFKKHEN